MNLAFTVTDSYVDYMATTLLSILETTRTPVVVYVLTSDISDYSRFKLKKMEATYPHLKVEVLVVEESAFQGLPLNRDHISRLEVYFRMAFASLLPQEVERVLYLDSDLLVQKDLLPLWETDLTGYYMAGVSEPPSEGAFEYRRGIGMTDPSLYFNSGVLLMDLKKIRQDQVQALLFETGERIKDKILLQDQDIINVALEGHIKPLDVTYNYGYMEREARVMAEPDVAIMHFSLEKPWADRDVIDYNRRAVDAYQAMRDHYRKMIEPLVTVLLPIEDSQVDFVKTLQTVTSQSYKHLDIILLGKTQDLNVRGQAWREVQRHSQVRYYQLEAKEDAFIKGVELSLGTYVTMVQAGDELDVNYLANLYQTLEEHGADVSLTSPGFLETQTGSYYFYDSILEPNQVISGADFYELVYNHVPGYYAHFMANRGLLWKRSIWTRAKLSLPLMPSHLLKGFASKDVKFVHGQTNLYLALKSSI